VVVVVVVVVVVIVECGWAKWATACINWGFGLHSRRMMYEAEQAVLADPIFWERQFLCECVWRASATSPR
jgi:hypothetical protein